MPASTSAQPFSRSIDRTRRIRRMSIETIVRVSSSGHSSAPLTLVPPPNGTRQASCVAGRGDDRAHLLFARPARRRGRRRARTGRRRAGDRFRRRRAGRGCARAAPPDPSTGDRPAAVAPAPPSMPRLAAAAEPAAWTPARRPPRRTAARASARRTGSGAASSGRSADSARPSCGPIAGRRARAACRRIPSDADDGRR